MPYFSDSLVIWKYLLLSMQDITTLHTHTRKAQATTMTQTERKAGADPEIEEGGGGAYIIGLVRRA